MHDNYRWGEENNLLCFINALLRAALSATQSPKYRHSIHAENIFVHFCARSLIYFNKSSLMIYYKGAIIYDNCFFFFRDNILFLVRICRKLFLLQTLNTMLGWQLKDGTKYLFAEFSFCEKSEFLSNTSSMYLSVKVCDESVF